MSFTPSTAAQNTAALAGSNQASLAAPLTALQTSISGGNLAPAALFDALLSSLGTQLESNNALGNNTTTSNSFADVPGSSITFTAPIAKSYTVHCDFAFIFNSGSNANFRLVVNGSNGPTLITGAPSSGHTAIHLMHSATCVAGANTIKVQWAANAVASISTNSNDYANYIVSG
jgi:hypothetical protein